MYADYKCLIHLDSLSQTSRRWSGSTFQDIRNPDLITQERIYNEITITPTRHQDWGRITTVIGYFSKVI